MELDDNTYSGGFAMHQPVDWDFSDLCPELFAPHIAANPVSQPQQQQPQSQQQQTAMATMTAMAATAPPNYAIVQNSWASSMHQPVDWELPSLPSLLAASASAAGPQSVMHPQPSLPTPTTSPNQPPRTQSQQQQQVPASSSALVCPAASQPQKESGGGSGGNSGIKRDRGLRRATTLRPQQQQMLELQKKLDALLVEHAVVEAENERLKTRLRVLEAVLPVRQQQAALAQSKAAAERATAAAAPPPDPVLANLIDLATSGPSSCATSPSRMEPPAATPAAVCGNCCCGASGDTPAAAAAAASDRCCAADDAPAAAPHWAGAIGDVDILNADSPTLAAAAAAADAAPCASSTCGTITTTTTTASGSTNNAGLPAARDHHTSHHNNSLPLSCSLHTTSVRRCSRDHYNNSHHHHHHHHHHHGHHRSHHGRGRSHGHGGGSDAHLNSHARWLDAWRAWVREAALLLQAYDARPNDHYLNRLEEAFKKLKSEVVYLGLRHPELICNMRCVNLETSVEQEFPLDSFWVVVVAGMKLDAQQVADCKSALALYRERMAVVLAERRPLAAQMSSCLTALQLEEAGGRAVPGSLRREQLTLEAEEAAAALDANVAAEGHTTSLARDLLGSNLFSRLQCARASVLSYPYFPDALAILTAAVGDFDTPQPQPPPRQAQQQQQPSRSGDAAAMQPPQQLLQTQA